MSKLHVDATLAAANRMAELQAENEQLKERIGDLEQNLRVAESARDDARAESQRPARSVKELVAEAVTLRDQMRNMQPATEAELDSLYAYARDRLDPDRPRELPVTVFVPGVRSVIDRRLADLEARVEQLENHPAGCSCTRCTG
jgi:chromosome segregation ATPase